KTIVKKAEEDGLDLLEKPSVVEIMKGHGLQAMLSSKQIYIGNKSGAEKLGVAVDPAMDNYLLQQQEKGYTAVLVTSDKVVIGIISIADQIREEAPAAIQALRRQGISHTVMLTGDNKSVAEKVAKQLGIDRVFAE